MRFLEHYVLPDGHREKIKYRAARDFVPNFKTHPSWKAPIWAVFRTRVHFTAGWGESRSSWVWLWQHKRSYVTTFIRPSKHSFIKGRAKQNKTALIATSPPGDRGTRWWRGSFNCDVLQFRPFQMLNSKWICDNKKRPAQKLLSPSREQKLTRLNTEESVMRATDLPNKQTAVLQFPTGCPTAFLRASKLIPQVANDFKVK